MAIPICYVQQDGCLHPAPYQANTLAEAAQHEPVSGVYTVGATRKRYQVLKLTAHLDRLDDSAARSQIPFKADRPLIRQALRQMIDDADFDAARFRISVPADNPQQIRISLEPYTPPSPDLLENGVHALTIADSARDNAAAKTTGWMHNRQALKATMPEGIYEMLLLNAEGAILEGLSSNFYAIMDDTLHTATDDVLAGLSQQIVLTVASAILPVSKTAIHIDDLPRCQGAFMTSITRGIIPIVDIDGQVIGDRKPGATVRALQSAYQEWVNAHLETL